MSHHKPTGKGPTYGEFNFARGGTVYVKGYVRGGKVAKMSRGGLANITTAADNLDNPRPSGITPTKINVKARMSPRYEKGGLVHSDAQQDKALIKKAIRQHDKNLHGGATDPIKLKSGGKAR